MNERGKAKTISERLRQDILAGKYDATRKLPSDRALMRRYSVARATVQAAMRDLLNRHLVDRKPGFGTFLADRAEVAARRKLGVIVPDAYYSFYVRICRGIDEAAKSTGWTILSVVLGTGGMRERARHCRWSRVCVIL